MGNELFFEGKKYISAKRASQITGYNSDYIGQLCRKGSLECKLVGRSWFVEEKSLSEHEVIASKTPRGRISNQTKSKLIPEVINEVTNEVNKGVVQVGKEIEAVITKTTQPVLTTVSGFEVGLEIPKIDEIIAHDLHALSLPLYDQNPFFDTERSDYENSSFAKKITTVAVLIILFIFSAPFLIQGDHTRHIELAQKTSVKITREINKNISVQSTQIASAVSSIQSSDTFLGIEGKTIREFRIKTHKLALRSYHLFSVLPNMFFDTANDMKAIVMREGEKIYDGGENTETDFVENESRVSGTRSGITVVPSSGDKDKDEKLKQYIKDSFSDETNVVPDSTGTSGVIKPIFKKQSDQDYLYVIVPVKDD